MRWIITQPVTGSSSGRVVIAKTKSRILTFSYIIFEYLPQTIMNPIKHIDEFYWMPFPKYNTGTNVPQQNIKIGELGNADSNGNLYIALPDDSDYDITPKIPDMYKYYTFNVGFSKHILYMTCNGIYLSKNRTTEFCVGQKLTFNTDLNPPINDVVTDYKGKWLISSGFINVIQLQWSPKQSKKYRIDTSLLENRETSLWYYEQGNKDVICIIDLILNNGQRVSCYIKRNLTIYRPSVSMFLGPYLPPSFNLITNYYLFRDCLCLGLPEGYNNPDMTNTAMNFVIKYESKYKGKGMITQLCQLDYSDLLNTSPSFTDWRCDKSENYNKERGYEEIIYGGNPNYWGRIGFEDAPSNTAFHPIRVKGNFKVYCRFRPDDPYEYDNIFVSLGIVYWSCYGETDSSHRLIKNSVDGPRGPDNSYEFPEWEDTYP